MSNETFNAYRQRRYGGDVFGLVLFASVLTSLAVTPLAVGAQEVQVAESNQAKNSKSDVRELSGELSEYERRLQSLAKSTEIEERPAVPTFESIKRTGGKNSITFDDIKFEIEKGADFSREMLTESIIDLVGRRLQIKGYIKPSVRQKGLSKFIFVRDDKECCFGPTAAIYDCVLVTLAEGVTSDFTVRPVTVEGEFFLKEYEGPDGRTWAVYRMKNGVVK